MEPFAGYTSPKQNRNSKAPNSTPPKTFGKNRDKLAESVLNNPQVTPITKRYLSACKKVEEAHRLADQIGEELQQLGLLAYMSNKGSNPCVSVPKYDKWTKATKQSPILKTLKEIEILDHKIDEHAACTCHTGEDPRILAFNAELSLVKTVGEAEALLEKVSG